MGRRLRPRRQYSPTSGDALRSGCVLCRFLRAVRRLLENRDHSISRQSLRHDLNDLLSRPFPDRVRQRNQVPFENRMPLNIGQLMSIPFILVGVYLIYASRRTPQTDGQ